MATWLVIDNESPHRAIIASVSDGVVGESAWHFGFIRGKTETEEAVMQVKRPTVNGERERAGEATKTLQDWMVNTPFARLEAAHERLIDLLAEASNDLRPGDGPTLSRAIQSAVADWLSTFRAFDDRTSHFLSREYGKGSEGFAAFKASLSLEYDLNPAYRFCVKLRNYCQHVGDPVQNMRFQSRETPELEGGPLTEAVVEFDPGRLLDRYDEWGAVVRAELERASGPLDVLSTLASAYLSCERIFASLMDSERPRLSAAIAVIDSFDVDPDGGLPTFFEFGSDLGTRGGSVGLQPVGVESAAIARRTLAQAGEILERPHHVLHL